MDLFFSLNLSLLYSDTLGYLQLILSLEEG